MVADGGLLGYSFPGGSGTCAVAMAKGHTIGKVISYQMTAEAACLEIENAEAQRRRG